MLFEHKSSPDRWAVAQMHRYLMRIYDRQRAQDPAPNRLVPVIPVLVYHGDRTWSEPLSFHELFDEELIADPDVALTTPGFRVFLDDLTNLSDAELLRRALGDFGTLAIWALRDGRKGVEHIEAGFARFAEIWSRVYLGPHGQRAVAFLLKYVWAVSSEDQREIRDAFVAALPEAEGFIVTIAQQIEATGVVKGQRKTLEAQLQAKFGQLAASTLERLAKADEDALLRYSLRVLSAKTLDEVFEN